MRTIAFASAVAILGAGALVSTSASAWDGPGFRQRTTTIHDYEDARPRLPGFGYRSVGIGDIFQEQPRYRTRRITREVIEYDDRDDDIDD